MAPSRWQSMRESVGWWFALLAVLWLAGAVTLLAVWWFRDDSRLPWFLLAYAAVTLLTSLFAFCAYGIDKRRAKRDGQRIPERVLHASALFGGWPGAFLAQRVFRHKTQKASFRLWFWLIVLLHGACIGYGIYLFFTRDTSTPKAAVHGDVRESGDLLSMVGRQQARAAGEFLVSTVFPQPH